MTLQVEYPCVFMQNNKHDNVLRKKNFMMLQVDPSGAWLRDNCDNTAYFPQDGNFNLQTHGLSKYTTLVVEGPSITAAPPRSNLPPSMTLTSTPSSFSGFQNFRSVTAPRRSPSFSLSFEGKNVSKWPSQAGLLNTRSDIHRNFRGNS